MLPNPGFLDYRQLTQLCHRPPSRDGEEVAERSSAGCNNWQPSVVPVMHGPRKRNEDDGNDYGVNSGLSGLSSRCAAAGRLWRNNRDG